MNKNKLFKIFVVLLLIVSLGCNGFLMYKVLGGNQSSGSSNSNATVQKVNYDVQSDLTEVIESAKTSTVGVAVYQNNQLAGSGSGVIYKVDGKQFMSLRIIMSLKMLNL